MTQAKDIPSKQFYHASTGKTYLIVPYEDVIYWPDSCKLCAFSTVNDRCLAHDLYRNEVPYCDDVIFVEKKSLLGRIKAFFKMSVK